jgi:hypothetical protein
MARRLSTARRVLIANAAFVRCATVEAHAGLMSSTLAVIVTPYSWERETATNVQLFPTNVAYAPPIELLPVKHAQLVKVAFRLHMVTTTVATQSLSFPLVQIATRTSRTTKSSSLRMSSKSLASPQTSSTLLQT